MIFAMVRARGTRIGGKIYGLERGCQGRPWLSKCKDSNAFTAAEPHLCASRPLVLAYEFVGAIPSAMPVFCGMDGCAR